MHHIKLSRILIPAMIIIANTCRHLLIPSMIIIPITYFNSHLFQELWLIYHAGLHRVARSFHLHVFIISMALFTLSQVIYCMKNKETYSISHAVRSILYSLASVTIHDFSSLLILTLMAKEINNEQTSPHQTFEQHCKAYLSCIMHGCLIFIAFNTILTPLIVNIWKILPFNTTLQLFIWAPILATMLTLARNKVKLFYWRANPGRWIKHLALGALSYFMTIAALTTTTNIKRCILVLRKTVSLKYLASVGILNSIQPLVEEIIFRTSLFNFLRNEKYTDEGNRGTNGLNLLQKASTGLLMAWMFGYAHAGVRKAKCINDFAFHLITGMKYSVVTLLTGGIEVATIWHALHNAFIDTVPMLLTTNVFVYSAMKILMFFTLKPLILTSEKNNKESSLSILDKKINDLRGGAQNDTTPRHARSLTKRRAIS